MSVAIVMDMGGTSFRVGHLDGADASAPMQRHSTDRLRDGDPIRVLADVVTDYATERGLNVGHVVIGVPASLDAQCDYVLSSPNILSLEGRRLRSELRAALTLPVTLDRDIVLLTRGERLAGAARGAKSIMGVFVGTGVGACLLIDGQPYTGATGIGLEIGHMPIRAEGRRCICGNIDCLEAYASGRALKAMAERFGRPVDGMFLADDPPVATEVAEFVRDLAYACAGAINLLDPELVLMGGGVVAMKGFPRQVFADTVRAHVRRPLPAEAFRIDWARLGPAACLHGARALIEPELESRPA